MELNSEARIPFDLIAGLSERKAAFTLEYTVTAKAELSGKSFNFTGPKNPRPFVRRVVENTLDFFGVDCGVQLTLSSSTTTALSGEIEASCVSSALAAAAAAAKEKGSVNELKIDKYLIDQFFIFDGKVVQKTDLLGLCFTEGLSYAKVASSFYGGFAVCEGESILRSGEMEDLDLLLVKSKSGEKKNRSPRLKWEHEVIWREVLAGNLYPAMNLSSLISSGPERVELIKKALSAGALAASIDADSTVFLARSQKTLEDVRGKTRIPGERRTLKTSSKKAWVNAKPKKIYKIKEFLELPGAQGYNII